MVVAADHRHGTVWRTRLGAHLFTALRHRCARPGRQVIVPSDLLPDAWYRGVADTSIAWFKAVSLLAAPRCRVAHPHHFQVKDILQHCCNQSAGMRPNGQARERSRVSQQRPPLATGSISSSASERPSDGSPGVADVWRRPSTAGTGLPLRFALRVIVIRLSS
jgi:hypothetical protein